MVCVRDVNQSDFVNAFAAFLKKSNKIQVPKWSDFAKTSPAREMPPADDDWFYTRVACEIGSGPGAGPEKITLIYTFLEIY